MQSEQFAALSRLADRTPGARRACTIRRDSSAPTRVVWTQNLAKSPSPCTSSSRSAKLYSLFRGSHRAPEHKQTFFGYHLCTSRYSKPGGGGVACLTNTLFSRFAMLLRLKFHSGFINNNENTQTTVYIVQLFIVNILEVDVGTAEEKNSKEIQGDVLKTNINASISWTLFSKETDKTQYIPVCI